MSINAKSFIGNPDLVKTFVDTVIPKGAFTLPEMAEMLGDLETFIQDPNNGFVERNLSSVREVRDAFLAEIFKRTPERENVLLILMDGGANYDAPKLAGLELPNLAETRIPTGMEVPFVFNPGVTGEIMSESGVFSLVKVSGIVFSGIYRYGIYVRKNSKPDSAFGPAPMSYVIGSLKSGLLVSPEDLARIYSALGYIALASFEDDALEAMTMEGDVPEPGAEYDKNAEEFVLPSEVGGRGVLRYGAAEFGPNVCEQVSGLADRLRIPGDALWGVTLAVEAMINAWGYAQNVKGLIALLEGPGPLAARKALRSFAIASRAIKGGPEDRPNY